MMPFQSMPSHMPPESCDARVTELPNEITQNIDVADTAHTMEMLKQSDLQLFEGYHGYANLYAKLPMIGEAIEQVEEAIRHPCGRVILSGSGTSGRIAAMVARLNNQRLKTLGLKESFMYLIAGGEAALLRAQESAEDLSEQAVKELQTLMPRATDTSGGTNDGQPYDLDAPVVFIALSCGMSATYSGAQAHWLVQKRAEAPEAPWSAVVMGFNPLGGVKNVPIKGWDVSFRDVLEDIIDLRTLLQGEESSNRCKPLIINPVVGPEPIAGSTRMKGGSATKIILDVIATNAMKCVKHDDASFASLEEVKAAFANYREVLDTVYENEFSTQLGKVAHAAGESLRKNGHIYYIGSNIAGVIALIDASECPPTYGAAFTDVITFVDNGFEALGQAPHASLTKDNGGTAGQEATAVDWSSVSLNTFIQNYVPCLTDKDIVIGVSIPTSDSSTSALKSAKQAMKGYQCSYFELQVTSLAESGDSDAELHLALPHCGEKIGDVFTTSYAEFGMKLVLNTISTIAHIMKGCIFQNRMINLAVTNAKLFRRTLQIIQDLAHVERKEAYSCLLRAIYRKDDVSDVEPLDISDHVTAAAGTSKVVPLALVLAAGHQNKWSCADAENLIDQEPVLRVSLSKLFKD